jgi:hypothetical protein
MKSSLAASIVSSTGSQASRTSLSVHSCGLTPLAWAVRSSFSPCSSVPVRNHTLSPRCRCQRVSTSPAVVVYALPMWGASFT